MSLLNDALRKRAAEGIGHPPSPPKFTQKKKVLRQKRIRFAAMLAFIGLVVLVTLAAALFRESQPRSASPIHRTDAGPRIDNSWNAIEVSSVAQARTAPMATVAKRSDPNLREMTAPDPPSSETEPTARAMPTEKAPLSNPPAILPSSAPPPNRPLSDRSPRCHRPRP